MKIKKPKHAIYSASGAERWMNCPASISFCKDLPPLPTIAAAEEGTVFHSHVERVLMYFMITGKLFWPKLEDALMFGHLKRVVNFVLKRWDENKQDLVLEQRVSLDHIDEDMYGTNDIGLVPLVRQIDLLEVWDIKYGKGHVVETEKTSKSGFTFLNPQLSFYAIGLARLHNYRFKKYLIGIIQPRVKHVFGTERYKIITLDELKKEEEDFHKGVERTKKSNPRFFEGEWCFFCKGKFTCPKKVDKKVEIYGAMMKDM